MPEKIRILKSRWDEVPSGTIAYISQCNTDACFMTCDSGIIIVLQGYPWRIGSVRNLRRWFFIWICYRGISVFNNWGCFEYHSRKRFNLFWYRKCWDDSENFSGVCWFHETSCKDWSEKVHKRIGVELMGEYYGFWKSVG